MALSVPSRQFSSFAPTASPLSLVSDAAARSWFPRLRALLFLIHTDPHQTEPWSSHENRWCYSDANSSHKARELPSCWAALLLATVAFLISRSASVQQEKLGNEKQAEKKIWSVEGTTCCPAVGHLNWELCSLIIKPQSLVSKLLVSWGLAQPLWQWPFLLREKEIQLE